MLKHSFPVLTEPTTVGRMFFVLAISSCLQRYQQKMESRFEHRKARENEFWVLPELPHRNEIGLALDEK